MTTTARFGVRRGFKTSICVTRSHGGPLAGSPRRPRRSPAPTSSRVGVVACRAEATQDQMDAARKRWEAQVAEGKIRAVSAAEAGRLVKSGESVLLDVRPPEEVEKGEVEGAVQVPLFVVDDDTSVGGLMKQMSAFGMGGWWLGNKHMKPNERFMQDVTTTIARDASVIVACQKGLRSLSACEQLAKAGYSKISWITGGLDTTDPGELPVKEGKDIRFAGNGGLSSFVGWTEADRKATPDATVLDGPFGVVLKIALGVLFADFALFAYEQINSLPIKY